MLDSEEATDAEKVRAHTQEILRDSITAKEPVLIEAPPNSGKTTSSYELASLSKTPITYLAGRTDLYTDAEEWAEEQTDITAKAIPSPQRNCPTFKGTNNGEKKKADQLYNKGVSGAAIHYHSDVYTPCHSGDSSGKSCEYLEQQETISTGLENGEIDFLIGNHKHAHNSDYIEDRIVIFDEFNPDPFRRDFPSQNERNAVNHPGKLVSHFLETLDDNAESFPTAVYRDVTDILLNRDKRKPLEDALAWFEEHGVSRDDVSDLDFYSVTSFKYDLSHRLAPLLTLGFLCMRKVGPGIEIAPPPYEYEPPIIRNAWINSGLRENVRCVRDRNTGKVSVLQPPDLTAAKQVIGLDGLPSKRLWDLIFGSGSTFDHRKVISRDDFSRYLSSALQMTVRQIGDGRHPYAGGRISNRDEYRFAAVKALEDDRFALISTKKALEEYESQGWIEPFVKSAPDTFDNLDDKLAVMNYATVVSSNVFEREDLGVVSGSPFPGYSPLRIWAGFCGQAVEIPAENESPSFDGAVADVYQYLNHHQVIQAILRFGRHREVWSSSGSTVYVITTALPDWFEVDDELTVEQGNKRTSVIEFLINAKRTDDRRPLTEQNVASLKDELDIDKTYINEILNMLDSEGLVTTSDRGAEGSILYQWSGDNEIVEIEGSSGKLSVLKIRNKVFVLDI